MEIYIFVSFLTVVHVKLWTPSGSDTGSPICRSLNLPFHKDKLTPKVQQLRFEMSSRPGAAHHFSVICFINFTKCYSQLENKIT